MKLKKYLFVFFFVITGFSIVSLCSFRSKKVNNCNLYRKGTFYYKFNTPDQKVVHFTFERNDSIQTEIMHETGQTSTLKIRWIDSCTYELRFISSNFSDDALDSIKRKMVLTTTIISGTDEYYIFKTTSNIAPISLSDTIWLKQIN